MADQQTGLVITAHPGDFVWRAGGAIALHAKRGYQGQNCLPVLWRTRRKPVRLERSWVRRWKKSRPAAKTRPNARPNFLAPKSSSSIAATIRSSSTTPISTAWSISTANSIQSFVLTHALEDPYNFDHPNAAHFAQETRVVAQAMGHKPDAKYKYSAPPVFLFEPHQPEMCNYKPNLILKIDEVWEQKYKASRFSPRKSICGPTTSGSRSTAASRAAAIPACR